MKKILSLVMALALALTLAACGQAGSGTSGSSIPSESESASSSPASTESTAPTDPSSSEASGDASTVSDGSVLVAYFSWSGNTQEMAAYIAEETGGDLLEIQPETSYPEDYNECGNVALAERDNNERPAIANLPDSIDQYDTILIGYPIWWHTAPMIIGTFLESYDLTGVDIYPFTQSASMDEEQFQNSMDFVRESADGATVHEGLFVRASDTAGIDSYLAENQLAS